MGCSSSKKTDGNQLMVVKAYDTDGQVCHSNGGHSITLVGGGMLGCMIATWLLILGETVLVLDHNPLKASEEIRAQVQSALLRVQAVWPNWRLPTGTPESHLTCLPPNELPTVARKSWLVIEAVPEIASMKQHIFSVAAAANTEAIIVSNSMNLDPNLVAQQSGMAEGRVFRMRFLAPVVFTPYVEITQTAGAEERIRKVAQWLEKYNMVTFHSSQRIRIFPDEYNSVQACYLENMALTALPGLLDIANVPSSMILERSGSVKESLYKQAEQCVVCLEAKSNVMSVGACTHICLCEGCALAWQEAQQEQRLSRLSGMGDSAATCPICRNALQPAVIFS